MQARTSGELIEMKFNLEASQRGFVISVPFVTHHYDCLLDNGKQILKVQIKSSSRINSKRESNWYAFPLKRGQKNNYRAYTADEVDVFALYVVPEDTWFFVPQGAIDGTMKLNLCVNSENSRYNAYKENWDVFKDLMK